MPPKNAIGYGKDRGFTRRSSHLGRGVTGGRPYIIFNKVRIVKAVRRFGIETAVCSSRSVPVQCQHGGIKGELTINYPHSFQGPVLITGACHRSVPQLTSRSNASGPAEANQIVIRVPSHKNCAHLAPVFPSPRWNAQIAPGLNTQSPVNCPMLITETESPSEKDTLI